MSDYEHYSIRQEIRALRAELNALKQLVKDLEERVRLKDRSHASNYYRCGNNNGASKGERKMICPKLGCGAEMEGDLDGYWCPKCEEYYPPDIIEEWLMENE